MIDVNPNYLKTVKRILAEHVPGCEVRAFGSRVKWTAKDYSDLDLAVVADHALEPDTMRRLREAFEEPDLPFRVDVADWNAIGPDFRKVIEQEYEVVQGGKEQGSGGEGVWPLVTIEDLAAKQPSALATGPFGSTIGLDTFRTSGVPVIRGSNLSEETSARLKDEDFVYISEELASKFARSAVVEGDLVFTCWGTINQVGLIDHRAKHKRYIVSNKQMKLTPDPKKADSLYLYYFFSSPAGQERILSQGIGSSVPGFNLGQLRAIKVPLPPLAEQRAIAHILGTLDEKIDLNRRMNETLEAMARAIFKSWFVDFDPVRAKAEGRRPEGMDAETAALFPDGFEDSALGKIPRGWRVAPLPEVIEVNPSRQLVKGAAAPYLDMQNMPTRGHRALAWIERPFGSGMRFQNGDTLVARITPCLENGKTAYVDFLREGETGWGSTEYIVLRPRPPLPPEYAYILARSDEFRAHAIQNMTGTSGRQRVPASCLDAYPVVVSSTEVANAFGAIARSFMSAISANARQNDTLASIRDALLPKLLSGEIRVSDL